MIDRWRVLGKDAWNCLSTLFIWKLLPCNLMYSSNFRKKAAQNEIVFCDTNGRWSEFPVYGLLLIFSAPSVQLCAPLLFSLPPDRPVTSNLDHCWLRALKSAGSDMTVGSNARTLYCRLISNGKYAAITALAADLSTLTLRSGRGWFKSLSLTSLLMLTDHLAW